MTLPTALAGAPPAPPAPGFFDALEHAYHAARAARGEVRRTVRVGEAVVTLRFAGDALVAPLSAALAHLQTAGPADLDVRLFDTASTGVAPPPAPWAPDAIRAGGLVAGYSDARFRTVVQVAVGLVVMLDRRRGRAVCWIRSPRQLPMPERAAPLRRLFQEWLGDDGPLVVHAGAVGAPGGGVLLAGQSGAGKSTAALACLASPLRYAADDYCLVRPGPAPHVHSLYSTGKTAPADLDRLPFLAPAVADADPGDEKTLYQLGAAFGDRLIAGFPLRAIVAPRVVGSGQSRLVPASGGSVLTALAATTVLLAPHRAAAMLPRLAALVRSVPTYRLEVGAHPRDVPPLLAELLDVAGTPR